MPRRTAVIGSTPVWPGRLVRFRFLKPCLHCRQCAPRFQTKFSRPPWNVSSAPPSARATSYRRAAFGRRSRLSSRATSGPKRISFCTPSTQHCQWPTKVAMKNLSISRRTKQSATSSAESCQNKSHCLEQPVASVRTHATNAIIGVHGAAVSLYTSVFIPVSVHTYATSATTGAPEETLSLRTSARIPASVHSPATNATIGARKATPSLCTSAHIPEIVHVDSPATNATFDVRKARA